MDPRPAIIHKRLENTENIIGVAGAKGGVGKSSVSSLLSLQLSEKGYKTGLLDLDFYGPSAHFILGAPTKDFPEEENGVIPLSVNGIKFMSISLYSKDDPLLMRGKDVTNAILELFTIVQWGKLDFLIIDMPPGIGETTLDAILFIKRLKFLLVTTPSLIAFKTVEKLIKVLTKANKPTLGIIENMKRNNHSMKKNIIETETPYLGSINYDHKLEPALGNMNQLKRIECMKDLDEIIEKNKGIFSLD